ncbi:MAG: hypothetical protein WCP69_15875 [Bacteroidota bacterium]
MKNTSFLNWYIDNIKKEESLITQTVASKMLNTSRQTVNDKVKRGTFTEFEYKGMKFVSFKEVKNYILKNM